MIRSARSRVRVTMPTRVQMMPKMLNRESCNFLRAINRVSCSWSAISVTLPEALAEDVSCDVEQQRHEEQHQSGREDRLITDAAMWLIAETDLDDIGGDGGGLVARVEGEV